jgi:flavin-dependent dehydrogenase
MHSNPLPSSTTPCLLRPCCMAACPSPGAATRLQHALLCSSSSADELKQCGATQPAIASIKLEHYIAGDHVLSGCVLDDSALNELFPRPNNDMELDFEWKTLGAPVATQVKRDRFSMLSKRRRFWLPVSRHMRNRRKYLVSLRCDAQFLRGTAWLSVSEACRVQRSGACAQWHGMPMHTVPVLSWGKHVQLSCSELTRWMSEQAEGLGVDILPSCAAQEALFDGNGSVVGVHADRNHAGSRDSTPAADDAGAVRISARATIFAEGCRGAISKVCS